MSTDVKCMYQGQITSFFIPTVTLVGPNCSKEIPNRLKSLGAKHPLIVTDKGIVACGILKQITDILDEGAKHLSGFISEEEYAAIYPQVEAAHKQLEAKNGPGSDFLVFQDKKFKRLYRC